MGQGGGGTVEKLPCNKNLFLILEQEKGLESGLMSDPITELMPNAFLIILKELNNRRNMMIYFLTEISVKS